MSKKQWVALGLGVSLIVLVGCAAPAAVPPKQIDQMASYDPEEAAALAAARDQVAQHENRPRIERELGCVHTTSAIHDSDPRVVVPVEGDPAALIWACDFDVVLTQAASGPSGYTPGPWPAEGKRGFIRVVLQGEGKRSMSLFNEEPTPLEPA